MSYLFYFIITTILFLTKDISCFVPCNTTEECTNLIPDTFCTSSNICRCPAGKVISSDVTQCLNEALHGDQCTESNQCSHMLTGSRCNNGICQCTEGYTFIRGRCKKLVNLKSPCNETADCFFGYDRESVVCLNNECQCADNYYERSENICRRKRAIHELCVVHQDCETNGEEYRCINTSPTDALIKNCLKPGEVLPPSIEPAETIVLEKDMPPAENSIPKIEIFIPDDKIEDSPKLLQKLIGETCNELDENECSNTPNAVCVDGECQCDLGYIADDAECKPVYGAECNTVNEKCDDLPHSICVQERCQCQKGYYESGSLCKAELGEVAESKKLCEFEFDPDTKKCVCGGIQFYGSNLRSCWKVGNGINWSCTEPSQCTPYGHVYCPVSPRRCTCHPYANWNEEKELCIAKKGLMSQCQQTDDCTNQLPNTVCTENLCKCQNNFIEVNEECKAGHNANCETDNDCVIENSECKQDATTNTPIENNTCQCKPNYVKFSDSCLKKVDEFEGECEENEQCEPLLGNLSKCINNSCTCDEEHTHFNHGKCHEKKALGESCKRSTECFVPENKETVECRKSVCECQFGYTRDIEKQICIIPTPKKNSSGRPSALKVITLLLIAAAILITSAALKEAYY